MESLCTGSVPSRDVLPYWNDVVCKTYVPITPQIPRDSTFAARLDITMIGRTSLTHVRSSSASYLRTRSDIGRSRNDAYLLSFLVRGSQRFSQAGRTTEIGPGDLCLFDMSRVYELQCSAYEAIHLKIPRADLDMRLPQADAVSAMRVASSGRYAQLATTMIRSTMDAITNEAAPPSQLSSTLLDLVALAFDECFGGLSDGDTRYSRIVDQAKEIILGNLCDPEFDVSTVSKSIGVSPRTLNRAFAQQGITPMKWLWNKRLEIAHQKLKAARDRSVSEVAMSCGFNDFSHFSRAFKLRYAQTPSAAMVRAN